MNPSRPHALAASLLAAALLCGGCSDDATTASSKSSASASSTSTTLAFGPSVSAATKALDAAGDDACALVAANRATQVGTPRTAAEVERVTKLTVDFYRRLSAAANATHPDEAKVVTSVSAAFGDDMAAATYDPATYAASAWSTAEFQQAYRAIAADCSSAPAK